MSVKPDMIKDEFTEKYFEESNPHNKELFNPNKAAIQPLKPKLKLPPATVAKSQLAIYSHKKVA